jgi:mannose-1-phosphate guanylyltransferase
MLHTVIMAGGSGTRFWPASRQVRPKQFLTLFGDRSLIQMAWDRCQFLTPPERCWVVAGPQHAALIREQLPDLPESNLVIEPCPRNTAACIGLTATAIEKVDPAATMAVLPSDHIIAPADQFAAAVRIAESAVDQSPESLVLFGISPTYPATGYGYIEVADASATNANEDGSLTPSPVVRFREKPDRATAEEFLRSGRFLWNSGIFVWRARRILAALEIHEPGIASGLKQIGVAPEWERELQKTFPGLPSVSIDYAVLEREAPSCRVLPAPFSWDDVGSWEATTRWTSPDAAGNHVHATHIGDATADSIIQSTDGHLIVTSGVENLLIVHTPDATLVARRDDEAAMRRIVEQLRNSGFSDYL